MEELGLFVKDIDNNGVRRRSAPEGKRSWVKTVCACAALLVILAFGYGPRAWLRQSGFRIAEMTQAKQQLIEHQDHLRVRYATLSGVDRVRVLAAERGLEAPPVENYTWQDTGISAELNESEFAGAFPRSAADERILD